MRFRDDAAREIFARVLTLLNDDGPISEEYDTTAGRLVGNLSQAFTHVGIINTAQMLAALTQPGQRQLLHTSG
jgi:GH15 family glucan-1,4-alpha-glucosidase